MVSEVFFKILSMSLSASVVILIVLTARLIMRKSPKILSYLLWSVVLWRLLCPIEFTVELPIHTGPIDGGYVEFAESRPMYASGDTEMIADETTDEAAPAVITRDGAVRQPKVTASGVLAAVWICGTAVMATLGIASALRLRRRLACSVNVTDNIYIADHIPTAFVFGLLRPRIYIPSGIGESETACIMLHERHHIKRLDHIVKLLAYAALCLHWFNPLVWLAYAAACSDMEMSCDEAVLGRYGEDKRKEYAAALLTLSVGRRFDIGMLTAFCENDTARRIKNIMKAKKSSFINILLCAVLCLVVICIGACEVSEKIPDNNIFGSLMKADAIVYSDPIFDFDVTVDTAPLFRIGQYGTLTVKFDILSDSESGWENYGTLSVFTLDEENFDSMFIERDENVSGWTAADTARTIREQNKKAWRSLYELQNHYMLHYVLEQNDGTVLIAHGSMPKDEKEIHGRYIRWLFKVSETDDGSAYELLSGEAYVSERSLFLNPLSSSIAVDDTGYRYFFDDTTFIMQNRRDGDTLTYSSYIWGWQEFPYTHDEWNEMFVLPERYGDFSYIFDSDPMYQHINDSFFLISTDEQLLIVNKRGEHIWSIHTLVAESLMGKAVWERKPSSNSATPYFTFLLDFDCTILSANCDAGGVEIVGNELRWYPDAGFPNSPERAVLHLAYTLEDKMLRNGTIYITAKELSASSTVYEAVPAGMRVTMTQSEEHYGTGILKLR